MNLDAAVNGAIRVGRSAFSFRALPSSCMAAAASSAVVFLTQSGHLRIPDDIVEAIMAVVALGAMMALWSAVIAVAVLLPLAHALHAITGRWDRPWAFGISGILALPLSIVTWVLVSKVFPGNERAAWDQLIVMAQNPARFLAVVAGLGVTGVTFSLGFARNQHLASIQRGEVKLGRGGRFLVT